MSNLDTHDAEQSAITAQCEAGTCLHRTCWGNITPTERAMQIMDETDQTDEPPNARRAARVLLAIVPSYNADDTASDLADAIADMLHLCDLAGLSFADIERRARINYQQEVADIGIATDETLRKIINGN